MILEKKIKEFLKQRFFSEDFKKLELISKFDYIDFNSIGIIQEIDCFNSDNIKCLFTLHYYGNNSIVNEFESILTKKVYTKKLDLKILDSISNSKSKRIKHNFKTLFEFGNHNNIDYSTCLNGLLTEALKHTFTVDKYNWSNKLEWINSGTSHRMASFIYHLFCNKQDYKVDMEITEYDLDKVKLEKIFLCHDIFILSSINSNEVTSLLFKTGMSHEDIITVNKSDSLVYIFIKKNDNIAENLIVNRLKRMKESEVIYLNKYTLKS